MYCSFLLLTWTAIFYSKLPLYFIPFVCVHYDTVVNSRISYYFFFCIGLPPISLQRLEGVQIMNRHSIFCFLLIAQHMSLWLIYYMLSKPCYEDRTISFLMGFFYGFCQYCIIVLCKHWWVYLHTVPVKWEDGTFSVIVGHLEAQGN